MIKSVQRMGEERFIINNAVIVSDFDYSDSGVNYNVSFDDALLTTSEADEIAKEFVESAILNFIEREQ